nr:hemolysin III family protein [Catenisphaera adipataccumulans]
MAHPFQLTFGEEVANSVSHGVMAFLLLLALPYFAVRSYLIGGVPYALGSSIFLLSLWLMFMTSCLYHLAPYGTRYKLVFRKLDHIMILFAIAGSYTPVCLTMLSGPIQKIVLIVEWSMVLFGILLKVRSSQSHPKLSMTIYMVMGWMAIFLIPVLLRETSWLFIGLLIAGGLLYSIGAAFYSFPEKRYFHFIWHLLIIAASLCHMTAMLYFMI